MTLRRRHFLHLTLAGTMAACASRPKPEEKARHPAPPEGGYADIRQFGAKGDGTRDDTAAIQAAIDSAAPIVAFPPGRYLVTRSLCPRSHQQWRGAGASSTLILQPQTAPPPSFNLIERRDGLENMRFSDLGFIGNGASQAHAAADGQSGFAGYIRGIVRDIVFQGCRITGFGDGHRGGGGLVLGPGPGPANREQALEDIVVEACVFDNNGNVPGLYIGGGEASGGGRRRNIRISGNLFAGTAPGTRIQNCLYILGGDAHSRIDGVIISGNRFDITAPADACIELNWVENFTVAGNSLSIRAAAEGSSGILLRDGCRAGTVTGNTLTDRTGGALLGGILLVNFGDAGQPGQAEGRFPGIVEDISITGNVLEDFSWRAIAADRGSRGIVVSANRIAGGGALTREAIRIAAARDILIAANSISGARHAIFLAGTKINRLENITIEDNSFTGCGGDPALIAAGEASDVIALVIRANHVFAPRAGTRVLVDGWRSGAALEDDARSGNVLEGNMLGGLAAFSG